MTTMQRPTADSGAAAPEARHTIAALISDRVLAVVRVADLPDVHGLCAALAEGGISIVELTLTIADAERHLATAARASADTGTRVGAGTVLTREQATRAVDAGAQFLVTPGIGGDAAAIVEIGHVADAAVVLGAFTASEVLTAMQLGADAVKIFPAHLAGPGHFSDLRGPFPDARLVASGGVSADNAKAFLDAGAMAVSAGTTVVTPYAVQHSEWAAITANAKAFRTASD